MPIKIQQIGPCFAGEVEGVDMTRPLPAEDAAAIHAGMDEFAMLVFHDQHITGDQQLAFTRGLGEIEHAIGTSLRAPEDHRMPTTFADVSNLDKDNQPFARDDRRRLFAIGNRLWHSDSSFKSDAGEIFVAQSRTRRGGSAVAVGLRLSARGTRPEAVGQRRSARGRRPEAVGQRR